MIHGLVLKDRTVSELTKPFNLFLASISKQVKILERAN